VAFVDTLEFDPIEIRPGSVVQTTLRRTAAAGARAPDRRRQGDGPATLESPRLDETWSRSMKLSRVVVGAALAAVFAASVNAQIPQRKAGLWEMQLKSSGFEAQGMPDMQEHMAQMPPEQRAQMEQYMKQRGISFGADSVTMRMCLTPQDVEEEKDSVDGFLRGKSNDNGKCKSKMVSRSGNEVRFTGVCKDDDGETRQIEGRIYDLSSEHFNLDMTSRGSKSGETKLQQKARWVSANCGNVK
jgi:hypothetical protein